MVPYRLYYRKVLRRYRCRLFCGNRPFFAKLCYILTRNKGVINFRGIAVKLIVVILSFISSRLFYIKNPPDAISMTASVLITHINAVINERITAAVFAARLPVSFFHFCSPLFQTYSRAPTLPFKWRRGSAGFISIFSLNALYAPQRCFRCRIRRRPIPFRIFPLGKARRPHFHKQL